MNELASVFELDEELLGGFDKYTKSKVVGDEKQALMKIVQNIDEMTMYCILFASLSVFISEGGWKWTM
ncbi:hypothetical protein, partial [Alicyclobacillus shizuokensis]|uniref:hypothetical protein n=1 Tax=Alicyclobacillus shizuokensis TaxID=392014 RepID=UPI000A8F9AF7